MYELKKWKSIFTSNFVGTGPSSYEKRIYRAAVLQRLRNTVLHNEMSGYRVLQHLVTFLPKHTASFFVSIFLRTKPQALVKDSRAVLNARSRAQCKSRVKRADSSILCVWACATSQNKTAV
jgi:hypothetical protein